MSFTWYLPSPVAITSSVPIDEGTRDLFGYDILHKNGNLQLSASGDYVRVGGMENLRLAVWRRLITRPGEYRFRPGYGVGVQTYVKKANTQANRDSLRTKIIEQLSQDKRIQNVDATLELVTINGSPVLRVTVKVTASGNSQTFNPFSFAAEAA